MYNVLGKGDKIELEDILKQEDEFKCYLRPVIEESVNGWGFIASNLRNDSKEIYPKIYRLRQYIQDHEQQRESVKRIKKD